MVVAFAVDGRKEGHGSVVCCVARADKDKNEESWGSHRLQKIPSS